MTTSTTPKGNPASANPMQGLSPRAQALLNRPRRSITLGKRYAGEIPNAFKTKERQA